MLAFGSVQSFELGPVLTPANYDEYSERLRRETKSIIAPKAAKYQIVLQSKVGNIYSHS